MIEMVLQTMPKTLGEFKAMPQMDLSMPQNTVLLFLIALDLFIKDKKQGKAMINLLKGPVPLNAYEESFLSDRVRGKAYLPMAYFKGASPKNNYTPDLPLTLYLYDDFRPDTEEGYIRFFLETEGADSKRPITLRKKDLCWYLWEYSSLLMGIRLPAKEDPWA